MSDNIHKGHRQRMKKVYMSHGFDTFAPHEVLEFLLYFVIPYSDTNPLAHRLIDRFKSLRGVLEAEKDELCAVEGVGESTAIFLKSVASVGKASLFAKRETIKLSKQDDIREYIDRTYEQRKNDFVSVIMLNNASEVIGRYTCDNVRITSPGFDAASGIADAVRVRASCVIICVNRTAEIAFPTLEETRMISEFTGRLFAVGIPVTETVFTTSDDMYFL